MQRYAERDIWGNLKPGAEIPSDLEENLRFTSYRYDPVIGKYFAQARFYDSANGRMLSKDPVKRGLNSYRYCDNDPADYVDPTGEIANIVGGALLGGGGGFLSSVVSQKMSGGEIDWKKALGAGINGLIVGATQGGLLTSGAGVLAALVANTLAGTAGSAAEQGIGSGRIDPVKSIIDGLSNAVGNRWYKSDGLKSAKDAFKRGAGSGAIISGLNYISDTLFQKPEQRGMGVSLLPGIAGAAFSPYNFLRNPRRGCGSASPFVPSLGYGSARGYQYDLPKIENGSQSLTKKFSLKDLLLEMAIGGVTGGVSSAAFYGAGKGIERLKEGLRPSKGGSNSLGVVDGKTPASRFANKLRGLSNSNRPNTVAVVRTADGKYYVGYNKAGIYNESIQDTLNNLGNSNQWKRQCAEVNALSRAFNKGADLNNASISIANVRGINNTSGLHGTYKEPCNVCQSLIDFLGIEDIH